MGWLSIHRGVDFLPVPFDEDVEEGDLVVGLRLFGEFDGRVLVVDVVVKSLESFITMGPQYERVIYVS